MGVQLKLRPGRTMTTMRIILLIICYFRSISGQNQGSPVNVEVLTTDSHLVWTDEPEMGALLPDHGKHKDKDGNPIAFRDIFAENMAKSLFKRYMTKVKNPKRFGYQTFRDPLRIQKGIHFTKNDDTYTIDMTTRRMFVTGLSNLELDYVRVARHFGLQDANVKMGLKTDLKMVGRYSLKGKALGLLPLTGEGNFAITLKNVNIVAKTYAIAANAEDGQEDKRKVVLKELDVQMTYDDVDFDFDDLMGGGVVGSTANMVINVMGEAIVESQKNLVISYARQVYHKIFTSLL